MFSWPGRASCARGPFNPGWIQGRAEKEETQAGNAAKSHQCSQLVDGMMIAFLLSLSFSFIKKEQSAGSAGNESNEHFVDLFEQQHQQQQLEQQFPEPQSNLFEPPEEEESPYVPRWKENTEKEVNFLSVVLSVFSFFPPFCR